MSEADQKPLVSTSKDGRAGSWLNDMRSDGSVDGSSSGIYEGSGIGISGWRGKAGYCFKNGFKGGAKVVNDEPKRRKVRMKARKKGKKDEVREGVKTIEGGEVRGARSADKVVIKIIGGPDKSNKNAVTNETKAGLLLKSRFGT